MFKKVLDYAGESRRLTYRSVAVLLLGVTMSVLPFWFAYQLILPLGAWFVLQGWATFPEPVQMHRLLAYILRNIPALRPLPGLHNAAVAPRLGDQFPMGPLLDDLTMIQYQDLIRILNGGQPVGDGDDSLSPGQF